MNRLLLLALIIWFSEFSFGQNFPEIDSTLLIKKARKTIIKTNNDLYKKPPELSIVWRDYIIIRDKSIDCNNDKFDYVLVSFINSEGHYANVIFRYRSKRKFLFLDCHFTIDTPQEVLDEIRKDLESYWGCSA